MDKKYIQELLDKTSGIEELVNNFFDQVQVRYSPSSGGNVVVIGFSDYSWVEPTGEVLETQRQLINEYEDWYSQSGEVIANVMPDRRPDFVKLYEENKEIIELEKQIWSDKKDRFKNDFLRNFGKQQSMLKSTLSMLSVENESKKNHEADTPQNQRTNTGSMDTSVYIDLKAQLTILSQQYSRIESDIKDLAQKVEGIGRITINNMNQNVAKTGPINISNENLVKWVKPDLDEELKRLKEELKEKEADKSDKQILNDLIETVIKKDSPKVDWLRDKVSQIKYWGLKIGVTIEKIKEYAEALGLTG